MAYLNSPISQAQGDREGRPYNMTVAILLDRRLL